MIDGSEKRNCEDGFWTSERVFEKCSKTCVCYLNMIYKIRKIKDEEDKQQFQLS